MEQTRKNKVAEEMDFLRYNSFLNALLVEFEKSAKGKDPKMQKQILALGTGVIDAFAEIYGDHPLRKASNGTSKMLAMSTVGGN